MSDIKDSGMDDLTPPTAKLLPSAAELRHRLAVAMREVDLLRRLIRVVEATAPNRSGTVTCRRIGDKPTCARKTKADQE